MARHDPRLLALLRARPRAPRAGHVDQPQLPALGGGRPGDQFRDWGIPLGRRFRALKLWFQLRLEGVEAIQARLRRDLGNAEWLAAQVREAAGWELAAPLSLQTLCVRHQPGALEGDALDEHNRAWAEQINRSGEAFLTPAKLGGRWVVRVSIGVLGTEREHVARLWELMQAASAA